MQIFQKHDRNVRHHFLVNTLTKHKVPQWTCTLYLSKMTKAERKICPLNAHEFDE